MRLLADFGRLKIGFVLIVVFFVSNYTVNAQTAEAPHAQIEKLIDAGRPPVRRR